MNLPPKDSIPDLLQRSLPRALVMAVEEALGVGAQRAHAASKGMHEGHLPHVVGQLRHFHMNEAFHRALAMGGGVADRDPRQRHRQRPIGGFHTGKIQYPGWLLDQRPTQPHAPPNVFRQQGH
jgi:hypothetical protein